MNMGAERGLVVTCNLQQQRQEKKSSSAPGSGDRAGQSEAEQGKGSKVLIHASYLRIPRYRIYGCYGVASQLACLPKYLLSYKGMGWVYSHSIHGYFRSACQERDTRETATT